MAQLGFGPTYHKKVALFEEQGVSTGGHLALWEAAANGEPVDFSSMLSGFNSGTDFPLSAFPDEMLATFRGAKLSWPCAPPTSGGAASNPRSAGSTRRATCCSRCC